MQAQPPLLMRSWLWHFNTMSRHANAVGEKYAVFQILQLREVCMLRYAALIQVFVRSSPKEGMDAEGAGPAASPGQATQAPGAPQGAYKFFFNIGSVDSFEAKMMEAQEQLGWDSDQGMPGCSGLSTCLLY